ncbi:MAG: sigma-70 family RNA polymerase sigma factor [Ginsengibacter sp.]
MSSNDLTWKEMTEGNENAFLTIYQENYRYLFSYGFKICGNKELTKDSIQSLFMEMWNRRNTIATDVQNVRSYLFTWLRRKISHNLSQQKKGSAVENNASALEPTEMSYEELLVAFQENEEQKEKLKRALNNLTKKQLEIIKLKFYENLSYDDISAKTSLATRTVYNIVYESILKLREFMIIFF